MIRIKLGELLIFGGLAAAVLAVYLGASQVVVGRLGFPLDDAWIHQTYARNLAVSGEWAFLPGKPSAGSTAPLWTLMLAIGHFLQLGPYAWTYLMGWLCLAALGWVGLQALRLEFPGRPWLALLGGGLLILEWHNAWAGASGMETLLQAALILLAMTALTRPQPAWAWIGALIGLSVWARPDGLTLLLPAGMVALLAGDETKKKSSSSLAGAGARLLRLGLGMLPGVLLYLWFNQATGGAWWPNTFYAKQAEYASYQQIPYLQRLLEQAGLFLVGPGLLLLPGFALTLAAAIRGRRWGWLAGGLWVLAYIALYAWRLPVTYQHGRYMMPAMPVYFLWGLYGMIGWLEMNAAAAPRRILSRFWALASAAATVAFVFTGARAYAVDVGIIETEMVATARWVAANTDPQAIVAAHDIGALGYFGERRLLDLAGLISPEVIPFIRDQPRLRQYLNLQAADYLVTFPGWYPGLVYNLPEAYVSGGAFSPQSGGENMAVYPWLSGR